MMTLFPIPIEVRMFLALGIGNIEPALAVAVNSDTTHVLLA